MSLSADEKELIGYARNAYNTLRPFQQDIVSQIGERFKSFGTRAEYLTDFERRILEEIKTKDFDSFCLWKARQKPGMTPSTRRGLAHARQILAT